MTIATSNTTTTFTINTHWLTPEHNEAVLALNEARDAAFAEIQDAYAAAYEEIDEQIQRLKAQQEVLKDERAAANGVVALEHQKAVKAARGEQEDDE